MLTNLPSRTFQKKKALFKLNNILRLLIYLDSPRRDHQPIPAHMKTVNNRKSMREEIVSPMSHFTLEGSEAIIIVKTPHKISCFLSCLNTISLLSLIYIKIILVKKIKIFDIF
jgi:hypothetical protein